VFAAFPVPGPARELLNVANPISQILKRTYELSLRYNGANCPRHISLSDLRPFVCKPRCCRFYPLGHSHWSFQAPDVS